MVRPIVPISFLDWNHKETPHTLGWLWQGFPACRRSAWMGWQPTCWGEQERSLWTICWGLLCVYIWLSRGRTYKGNIECFYGWVEKKKTWWKNLTLESPLYSFISMRKSKVPQLAVLFSDITCYTTMDKWYMQFGTPCLFLVCSWLCRNPRQFP